MHANAINKKLVLRIFKQFIKYIKNLIGIFY